MTKPAAIYARVSSERQKEDHTIASQTAALMQYAEREGFALERSRRGKRHRAQQGAISVLSGAPYGYRYMKKSDSTAAYYEAIEAEADVVRLVFQTYIEQGVSINAITRLLNDRRIPTREAIARWERSTVWAMLRNPAYVGRACFGKTELRPRQRITRPLRQHKRHATRNSANHERPRQDWIEIPVPALVSESTFALAQEQLERNRRHSPRRTVERNWIAEWKRPGRRIRYGSATKAYSENRFESKRTLIDY